MKIISIEGQDGVGKSTQADKIEQNLINKGYKVYREHFPRYNTPIGNLIGDILKGRQEMPGFDALQMLYAADQTDFRLTIERLIKEGYDYVILDRYMLSTMVYYCSKIDNINAYNVVSKWQEGIVKPDITIVLSSDVTINNKEEYKELDRFEKDVDFMSRISKNYVHLAGLLKDYVRIELVYANGSVDEVQDRINRKLEKWNLI